MGDRFLRDQSHSRDTDLLSAARRGHCCQRRANARISNNLPVALALYYYAAERRDPQQRSILANSIESLNGALGRRYTTLPRRSRLLGGISTVNFFFIGLAVFVHGAGHARDVGLTSRRSWR